MIGRHKFSSGIADSSDTALVLASDWNADVLLGAVLTNRTGGQLTAGDVVAVSSANDDSVVLADTAGARRQYLVFISALPSSSAHAPGTTINDTETGLFLPTGVATVKVAGAVTRGNYLKKSATAKALEDAGVAQSAVPPNGAIGVALDAIGGAGTISVVFHGLPYAGEAYPVGAIFLSVVATDPATLLGYGTWSAIAAGRILVGLDAADPDFDTLEETGGGKTLPNHVHPFTTGTASVVLVGGEGGAARTPDHTHSGNTGNPSSNPSIMNPYLVVKIWKRVS